MSLQLIKDGQYLRSILDAIPSGILIADKDFMILDANKEPLRFIGFKPDQMLYRLCGEALQCLNSKILKCGSSSFCKNCVIRQTMNADVIEITSQSA